MKITIEMPAKPEGVTGDDWRRYLREALTEPNGVRRRRVAERQAKAWGLDASEIRVPQAVFGD